MDPIRTGVPSGALRARPDLTGTGVFAATSGRLPSSAVEVGPSRRPTGTADPRSFLSSPTSCRPRDNYFGETTLEASRSLAHDWWAASLAVSRLVLAGLLCYRSSGVVDGVSREILVGSPDTDTVPTSGGIFPS